MKSADVAPEEVIPAPRVIPTRKAKVVAEVEETVTEELSEDEKGMKAQADFLARA